MFAKLIIDKQNSYSAFENAMTDSIIKECLNGTLTNKTTFYDRMRLINIDITSAYKLLVIDISSYAGKNKEKNFLQNMLQTLFFSSLMITYMGNIVIFADINRMNNLNAVLMENESKFKKYKLRVAVSDVIDDLINSRSGYKNALSALLISSRIHDNATIIRYENYKIYDMIIAMKGISSLSRYESNVFKQIRKYDAKNSTYYCDTLFEYIIQNKKLDDIASTLSVHKNTVSYRIKKARELFDIDVNNVEGQFRFYYSYIIEQMRQANLI